MNRVFICHCEEPKATKQSQRLPHPAKSGPRNDKEESLDTLNESSREGIKFTPSYRR
jgi:hypothetical protein